MTRKALESSYRGGCKSVIIGLTDTSQEIGIRPFQLLDGRNLDGDGLWWSPQPDGRAEQRRLVH